MSIRTDIRNAIKSRLSGDFTVVDGPLPKLEDLHNDKFPYVYIESVSETRTLETVGEQYIESLMRIVFVVYMKTIPGDNPATIRDDRFEEIEIALRDLVDDDTFRIAAGYASDLSHPPHETLPYITGRMVYVVEYGFDR